MAGTTGGLIQEPGRGPQGRDGSGPAGAATVGDSGEPGLEGRKLGTSCDGDRGGAGSTWTS